MPVKKPISRRRFLASSATLVGSVTIARFASEAIAAEEALDVYGLDPKWGGVDCQSGACQGCRACSNHGANKLFATSAGANLNRAHLHCKCKVVVWGSLPASTWTKLFGSPEDPDRLAVDRRDARVREILDIQTKVFVPLIMR